MFNRKSQISMVIIIGAILLLASVITIYLVVSKDSVQIQPMTSDESLKLQNYLQSCLMDAGTKAVYRAGKHGGYIAPKGDDRYKEEGFPDWQLYFYEQSSFPYALNKQNMSLIPKSMIQQKISNFVLYELDECIDAADFEKENFKIQKPVNSNVQTKINTNDILITADYPLKLVRGNYEVTAQEVVAKVPVRFGHVYDIAYKLIKNIKDNQPYDISRNCLEYGNNLVNIYLIPGKIVKLHALRIVDAQPIYQKAYPSFEFRVGVKNVDVAGECVG